MDSTAVAAADIPRSEELAAKTLEGSFAAWRVSALPTMLLTHLPPRHADGQTWWITPGRSQGRPDRIVLLAGSASSLQTARPWRQEAAAGSENAILT
jgi:hypothetical protein